MDAFDQRQADMEKDLAYTYATLSHFVFYWLTRSEPIPEGGREITHALDRQRHAYFLDQVELHLDTTR